MKKFILLLVLLVVAIITLSFSSEEIPLNVEYTIDTGLKINPQVFVEVKKIFQEANINLIAVTDTFDILDIFPYPNIGGEQIYFTTAAQTRIYKNAQHVLLAKLESPIWTFGFTIVMDQKNISDSSILDSLDKVGSIVFLENLNYWTFGERGINWQDSIVTYDELLVKVIVHELGHQLGLHESENLKSVMCQGMELQTIQGPNGTGPEFLKEDIEGFRFDSRLGINRVRRI